VQLRSNHQGNVVKAYHTVFRGTVIRKFEDAGEFLDEKSLRAATLFSRTISLSQRVATPPTVESSLKSTSRMICLAPTLRSRQPPRNSWSFGIVKMEKTSEIDAKYIFLRN
jgi:hypothetical protein